jgi:hypothetical protein
MRDIAVGIWQKIAGKNLHGGEEDEEHRRASKRLGPKAHLPLSCHIRSRVIAFFNDAKTTPEAIMKSTAAVGSASKSEDEQL